MAVRRLFCLMELNIDELSGTYRDDKGWGKQQMFFEQSFHMGSARMDFNNRELVDTLLTLSFSDYDTNIQLRG